MDLGDEDHGRGSEIFDSDLAEMVSLPRRDEEAEDGAVDTFRGQMLQQDRMSLVELGSKVTTYMKQQRRSESAETCAGRRERNETTTEPLSKRGVL